MKTAEENALIKFQRNTYNVLKLRFENTFHGLKSPNIPVFCLDVFGDLMYLDQSCPCKSFDGF